MGDKIQAYAAYEAGLTFKPFEYTARPLGDEDVEIEIHYSGICHSDLHCANGEWGPVPEPVVVGHEIAGLVTKVGAGVKNGIKVGDRVGLGPQVLSCGSCRECHRHQDQYCQGKGCVFLFNFAKRYPTGEVAHGGYARAVRAHSKFVIPIPDSLPLEVAAPLMCAGVTTFKPVKDLGVGPDTRVGVVGIGGLGHLAMQWSAKMGAEVTAISSSDRKRAEATELGAKGFFNITEPANFEKFKGYFDVIIMTGSATLDWNALFGCLRVAGKFCFLGAPPGDVKLPVVSFLFSQISITGSLIGSPEELKEMIAFAAKHNVAPRIKIMPLDEVNNAVQAVYHNQIPDGKYRVVLDVLNGSKALSKH